MKHLDFVRRSLAAHRRWVWRSWMLRLALPLAAIHIVVLAICGWMSTKQPLEPLWYAFLVFSYLIYLALLPAGILMWRSSRLDPGRIATILDNSNPDAPDPFRTVLSLDNHEGPTLERIDRHFAPFLGTLRYPRKGSPGPVIWSLVPMASIVLATAAYLSGDWRTFGSHVVSPVAHWNNLPKMEFALEIPRTVVGRGDTVMLAARPSEFMEGQQFHLYIEQGKRETRYPLELRDSMLVFRHGPVESDFSAHFAASNGRSRSVRVEVVERPFWRRSHIIVEPPAYTQLPAETLSQGVNRFSVLPGTQVVWELESNRPLRRATWNRWSGNGKDSAQIDTLKGSERFRVARSVTEGFEYVFELTDGDAIASAPGPRSALEMRPDLKPELEVIFPPADTVLDKSMKQPVVLFAKDDFGLRSLQLDYKVSSDGFLKEEGSINLGEWLRKREAGLVQAVWDLDSLDLRPENVVEYYFTLYDNDTVSGPKATRTEPRRLRLPSIREVIAEARERESQAQSLLRSAQRRQDQVQRKMERLQSQDREEKLPPASSYDINRIMVREPGNHAQRMMATLDRHMAELSRQKLDVMQRQEETARAERFRKQIEEQARRIPEGDQMNLELEQRNENLEKLNRAQREMLDQWKDVKAEIEKHSEPFQKMSMQALEKELERNIAEQDELKEYLAYQKEQQRWEKELMKQTLKEQEEALNDVKQALKSIEEMVDKNLENGLLSEDVLEKLERVQELLDQVMPDSVKNALREKLEREDVSIEELQKGFQEMMKQSADMEQNLNQAISMLENLRQSQALSEWQKSFEELAKRQEEMSAELKKDASEGQDAAALQARQENVEKDTRKALEEMAESGDSRAGKMAQEAKGIPEEMQKARSNMAAPGSRNRDQAREHSDNAAQMLAKMSRKMDSMMGGGGGGMSMDPGEVLRLLQESMALSKLQTNLHREGTGARSQGWEERRAALASASRAANHLLEEVRALAAKMPMVSSALLTDARELASATSSLDSERLDAELATEALKRNRGVSRELLKLYRFLKDLPSQGGGGGGGGQQAQGQSGQGQGQGQGQSSLSERLKGLSGRQMAINQSTTDLLRAMLEARRQAGGSPQNGGQQGNEGSQEGTGSGESGRGQGSRGEAPGQGEGQGGGSSQSVGNRQGELGEALESLAESADDRGGAARKLRELAKEARQMEEELRQGRPRGDFAGRQERFRSRMLEAARALEERGFSQERKGEGAEGTPSARNPSSGFAGNDRIVELLRQSQERAGKLSLDEDQRRRLRDFYREMLAR